MHFFRAGLGTLSAVCSVTLALAGCASPVDPVVCTAVAVDAIVVTVVDDTSGQRLCDATVTAVEGSFSQELRAFPAGAECTYSGPTERAGVYEVRVTKAGYAASTTSNVRVSRDECHVIPVRLTVSLRRAS